MNAFLTYLKLWFGIIHYKPIGLWMPDDCSIKDLLQVFTICGITTATPTDGLYIFYSRGYMYISH